MKRLLFIALTLVLIGSVFAGCAAKKEDTSTSETTAGAGTGTPQSSAKPVTLKIFNAKVEIVEKFNSLKAEYEKAHPGVTLDIETVVGSDYSSALKTKFASAETPDIFNNGGFLDLDTWATHLEDLSNEPWVKDVNDIAKVPMTKDGKVYGMPMGLEGFGFLYNKDLFAKAGITELPKTLTQLTAVVQKLKDNGITPFVNLFQEWYIFGVFFFNTEMAKQTDFETFVKGLNDGSAKFVGNPIFEQSTNLLDLMAKNGSKNQMTTDYNTGLAQFANGEGAMTLLGNWVQPLITKINPNFKAGILPVPSSDDVALNDKLYVGVSNNWVINKDSKVKPEAKEFLNWMVTSDIGKSYLTKEFGFIPAMNTIKANPSDLGDMAADLVKYSDENKLLGNYSTKFSPGAWQEFGTSMQKYVVGKTNRDQMLQEFQNTWDKLKTK